MKYPVIFIAAIIFTVITIVIGIIINLFWILWSFKIELTTPFIPIIEHPKGAYDWFPIFDKPYPHKTSIGKYRSYVHWIWGIEMKDIDLE